MVSTALPCVMACSLRDTIQKRQIGLLQAYFTQHDINEVTEDGWTAVSLACRFDFSDGLQWLLAQPHMDVNVAWHPPQQKVALPLAVAVQQFVRSGNLDCFELLVQQPTLQLAGPVWGETGSVLHWISDTPQLMNVVLTYHPKVVTERWRNGHGQSFLHHAVAAGGLGYRMLVWALKASVMTTVLPALANEYDFQGETLLHTLAGYRPTPHMPAAIARLLMLDGVQINLPDREGNTALHLTLTTDEPNWRMAVALLKHPRLEINRVNPQGETALHLLMHQFQSTNTSWQTHHLWEHFLDHPDLQANLPDVKGVTPLWILFPYRAFNVDLWQLFCARLGLSARWPRTFWQPTQLQAYWPLALRRRSWCVLLCQYRAQMELPTEVGWLIFGYWRIVEYTEDTTHDIVLF